MLFGRKGEDAMTSGEFNSDTMLVVNTVLARVDNVADTLRKDMQRHHDENRDDVKGIHMRIDGLTDRLSKVETRMDERDKRETSRTYGRIDMRKRSLGEHLPALEPKGGWVSSVINHPALPWLLALVIILVAGIVCFSVLSGRDWKTITPMSGHLSVTEAPR